ncbi:MAG: hypothetical protein IKK81_00335 [Prevotella sp.]|nr:hypothetical protein [Prevotella sp.]
MIRKLILSARVISAIFTPFYLPLLGLLALFVFSYLSLLPWVYKLTVLGIVFFFTVLLPTTLIRIYRHCQGWTLIELGQRERRMVPYIISIICYFLSVYVMDKIHIPAFMSNIIIVALIIQIACALVNVVWKISTHMAAIGGVIGALMVFSFIFHFNPLWWLCILLLIAGLLGTSRMVLRQHSLSQVVGGFALGAICAVLGIAYL